MKKKYLLVVFFAVFMVGGLLAQPNDPNKDKNGGGEFGLPIDGGIITLVVAGVAYGIKRSYKHNA